MGATNFATFQEGPTVYKAFVAAVDNAQHEHGHGGYTGTIAEKSNYVIISSEIHTMKEAGDLAESLIDDPRVDDKWGPCGAIRVVDGDREGWYFFGWASE
jgi:hypothetical protein